MTPGKGGRRTIAPGRKQGPVKSLIRLTPEAAARLRQIWASRVVAEPGISEDAIVSAAVLALGSVPSATR